MKKLLWMLAVAAPLGAQPGSLSVIGTTATQAVLYYIPPSQESCLIEVSESPSYATLVNDVNGDLFPGANTDADRSVLPGEGARVVIIGKRTSEPSQGKMYSRALRSFTQHYARITCDGNPAEIQFRTAETSGLIPEPPPFNPAADGNMAVPDFDWSDRGKPVIDPQTGVAIYRITDPRDYSSNTAHNFPSGIFFGGSGWTNPANITTASTSTLATTTTTNPIFIPIDSTTANTWGGWLAHASPGHPVTDMAIRLFGRGLDASAANRTVSVCISVDSGQTCWTPSLPVVLPQGTAADVGLTPANYPNPLYAGWGKVVTREFFTSIGKVIVSAGVVTLTKDEFGSPINANSQSARSRFHAGWPTGAKIFIANSDPTCPSNYCTIASVASQTQLTITENLTLAENTYKFAGLGFRITKTNASGDIGVSASYRIAKSFVMHQGGESGCSTDTVQTTVDRQGNSLGRTITGYLCVFPAMFESGGRLYFVGSSEPEVRFLSLIRQPTSITGHASADLPSTIIYPGGPNTPTFEPGNPNVFYTGIKTNGGSTAIYKLTYTGDYRDNSTAYWQSSSDSTPAQGDNNLTWENLTKSGEGRDLRSQILANTNYDETKWGSLGSLNLDGIVNGEYVVFNTAPIGGGETPCWVFVFRTTNGNFVNGWNTLNGGGEGSLAGGCHHVGVAADRITVANNGLRNSNTSSKYGGPFDVAVTSILKGPAFSTDTSLPAPGDGSYEGVCPVDLPQKWMDAGAIDHKCVTLRIPGEPCSSFATAAEKAEYPCPSDPNKSWVGVAFGEGQDFYDGNRNCDDEHFMVVRRTDLGGGVIEVVLLRDAGTGYCCQVSDPRGRLCLAGPSQATHANGWKLRMTPKGSCCSCPQMYDPATGEYIVEEQNLVRGHFSYELLASGNHTFAGVGNSSYVSRYNVPSTSFGKRETAAFAQWPPFAGVPGSIAGSLQSYIATGGSAAGDFERRFAADWRHPNGNIGLAPEASGQTIGSPYTLTLQSGTSAVYRVSTISGSYDPKRTPLIVWAGRYILAEKSSAIQGDTLTDADLWHFCYAYEAGECRSGSVGGQVYVVVPKLQTDMTLCQASQISYRSLCVFAGTSVFAQITQLRIDKNDPAGLWQRRLGYGLTRPGSQYVYSKAKPLPDGKSFLATSWNLQGVYSVPILLELPPWPNDEVNRTTFVPVEVRSSGSSYVEFGYEEYGARDQFFCTPRAEACRVATDSINEQNPFSYAHEPLTPASGDWKIVIPALSGRVLYYRIVSAGNPGPTQVAVVP